MSSSAADTSLETRLERFFARALGTDSGVRLVALERPTEGFSQESFFVELERKAGSDPERRRFVIKREPVAGLLEPYDLEPEFRVLATLSEPGLPSPRAHWLERDPAVLERPFYVMDRLPGRVPIPAPRPDGSPVFDEAERAALTPQVVEALAALHSLDWRAAGLGFLLPDDGRSAAERELARWRERIAGSKLEMPATLLEALLWLERSAPPDDGLTLVHGDFRLGNWLVEGEGGEARLTGVLDWEMVHVGDPHEDLAWCISPMWRARTPWAAALAPAEGFVADYQERTGRPVDPERLHWYGVLAVVKMIAIAMTGLRTFLDGRSQDLRMAIFDHHIPFLCAILAVLRGWLPEEALEQA